MGKTKLNFDIDAEPFESLRIALNLIFSKDTEIGDQIGFRVGRHHFTIVKDTGYVSVIRLKKFEK